MFIGEESLLLRCAGIWLENGNSISGVFSSHPQVIPWCTQHNFHCYPYAELADVTRSLSFDYLLSITNLNIVPQNIVNQAAIAAINYHDGPLPDYIGINTPSWAIINGENSHAICFHLMAETVDSGNILARSDFNISDDETSLTLNAKCYQHAESTFSSLVPALSQKQVIATPQRGNKSKVYTKRDRPCPVLDWSLDATQLKQLVNALDFGTYNNPLCKPVVWTGQEYIQVTSATPDNRNSDFPGKIISAEGKNITVACKNGAIKLTLASALQGVSDQLPSITSQQLLSITDELIDSAKTERYWLPKLTSFSKITLPDQVPGTACTTKIRVQQLDTTSHYNNTTGTSTLAILLAYLGRLSAKQSFDLTLVNKASSELTCLSKHIPFHVDSTNLPIADFQKKIESDRAELLQHTPFSRDYAERIGSDTSQYRESSIAISRGGELPTGQLPYDLLFSIADDGASISWQYNPSAFSESTISRMQKELSAIRASALVDQSILVKNLSMLSAQERAQLTQWNNTDSPLNPLTIHRAFEQRVDKHPDSTALVYQDTSISYRELNARANHVARYLTTQGIKPGDLVGVLCDRDINLIIYLFGVLKTGAAYVPLDPVYPVERLEYMVEDSGLAIILAGENYTTFLQTQCKTVTPALIHLATEPNSETQVALDSLAYVIYTSGSTGNPKGVMVEHRNVDNFLSAMDQQISERSGTWLAVTSISFDISVLEVFWTLTRGFKVVLYNNEHTQQRKPAATQYPDKTIDLSLFYWNVATETTATRVADDKYRLLLEGAKFADENGFAAVWNPERHFSAFGGSFPNPAVTCAAVAATTKNIDIRAGSCVAPLHSPIRIAEDWSVIDNLSNGRAGVAFASGWAAPDFAIRPDHFADAKSHMFEQLETVQQLWRGESVDFPGPKGTVSVKTLPRPIQSELPVWITTAGNPDNFTKAGEVGANLLTHLLGQTIDELKGKIELYQEARLKAGHTGPGQVTVMLHTCVGENRADVKALVEKPMKEYLKSAMFLVKEAAWSFPTFKQVSEETGATLDSFFETISEEDMDALLQFAFERYFSTSGLFGSVDEAVSMLDRCKEIGVNEVACLIDFGMADDDVLQHLPYLAQARQRCNPAPEEKASSEEHTVPALIRKHGVTHLQCTPSMAALLMVDRKSREAVATLEHLLVGGEALPLELSTELSNCVTGKVSNMYGPTETTIWSTTSRITRGADSVDIGTPIANTQIYIVDEQMQLLPPGLAGELLIGGNGVVPGYLNNKTLTSEKFIRNPFDATRSPRLYRTGDLAKYDTDGKIHFLGRIDNQVKIHGYRVELGEIETALLNTAEVNQAVVCAREDTPGDKRLVAYLVPASGNLPSADELRSLLSKTLPSFMLPASYVPLKTLPLTPNGKIDRNALPAPGKNRKAPVESLPKSGTESAIESHWKAALGVDQVGKRENFFDIGGHSLLIIDVMRRINNDPGLGKELSMVDLYRHTTIEALANFFDSSAVTVAPVTSRGSNRASSRKAARARRRITN
ncbi:hypothetical protein AB833_26790 [Chromatiales bacterium (ex Bugula neritina AB1)]|nr:hypothetical protein AB833_26790 [Chromatiales bacterium (ex Bugula neritina AB1)]